MRNFRKIFTRPFAPVAAVALIIVAGAGAAAAGQEALGQSFVAVEEPLRVTAVKVEDRTGRMGVVNQDGTYFMVGAEVYPGETYQLQISLDNLSGKRIIALLEVQAPVGFSVRAGLPSIPAAVTAIVPSLINRWVLEVSPRLDTIDEGKTDLVITVAVSQGVVPGSYNLSFDLNPYDLQPGSDVTSS